MPGFLAPFLRQCWTEDQACDQFSLLWLWPEEGGTARRILEYVSSFEDVLGGSGFHLVFLHSFRVKKSIDSQGGRKCALCVHPGLLWTASVFLDFVLRSRRSGPGTRRKEQVQDFCALRISRPSVLSEGMNILCTLALASSLWASR